MTVCGRGFLVLIVSAQRQRRTRKDGGEYSKQPGRSETNILVLALTFARLSGAESGL